MRANKRENKRANRDEAVEPACAPVLITRSIGADPSRKLSRLN